MAVPYTFANATGNIALSELDANFANVSQNSNRANTAGTVTTAAQPNITSVGTLTSLAVTGNITGGNVISTFYGSAIGLTTIPGANVLGAVPVATTATSADYATSAGTANVATISSTANTANVANTAGTVTTAAQPNITSVGTLTSLTVTGNITSSTGLFTGNGAGLTNLTGANITGTVANATYAVTAGTVTTAAQPNITSVGNLTSLNTVGNIATTGNISFGFNGNGLLYCDNVSSVLTSKNTNDGAFLGTGSGNIIIGASPFVGALMVTDFNTANRGMTWNNGTLDLDGLGVSLPGNIANVGTITSSQVISTPVALGSLTATAGARAFINNGNLVASGNFGAQVGAGGANTVPVWSDGTNWYIG